jgi:N-acetyl-anhydromuramyl-L-alanine amidase AmpD
MAEGLTRYGYDPGAPPQKVIAAFQRHFRPACVSGMADDETRGVLAGLLACQDAAKGAS